jgi:flagellar motor protein MotB
VPAPPAPEPAPPAPEPEPAIATGDERPFPGHFRTASATFWFDDEVDGLEVVERIKNLGSGARVKIVGHPTRAELADGQGSMGLSRAWAVRKYLIRHGIDPDVLTTVRGRAVEAREDLDSRGWAQNRWVGLIFE